jgi:hypothetical protein
MLLTPARIKSLGHPPNLCEFFRNASVSSSRQGCKVTNPNKGVGLARKDLVRAVGWQMSRSSQEDGGIPKVPERCPKYSNRAVVTGRIVSDP